MLSTSRLFPTAPSKLIARSPISALRSFAPAPGATRTSLSPISTFANRSEYLRPSSKRVLPPRHTTLPRPQSAIIRHCSYRRNKMCRSSHMAEESSGSVLPARELLPANVIPRHYDLTLEPDFEKLSFEGKVVIDLDVVEDSESFSLHTLELDLHSVKISSAGGDMSTSAATTYDSASQVTKIDCPEGLKKGTKAQAELTFTGYLNDKMAGFYKSTFKRDDGSEGIMAVSQMEATDARRAFPCFDEPALKAEFTVTLIADKKLTCLSNMDVASEKEITSSISGTSKQSVTFNKSPLMSTYLLAMVVGELNCIETNAFRVPIRVFAPPGQDIEHGRFSLDLAARTLAFYEKVFGIDFPLPKMDQVAIPDFAAGAMENWGLITYRVVDLLLDEKSSGAATKERVAEVVQHELAHQWFGNLVTMDWWDGLWLNEGFATWASWYSCNAFFPEWKVWQSFVTDNLQSALGLDSLRSSHPVEVPVKRADEIAQIFDAISYSKGSCVLRMISTYLGEDTFLEGVRRYLKKHAYGNTDTRDLWASLSEASGKDVETVMATWTKQVGYPVVTVTEDETDGKIHVKQNRFIRTGDVRPEEDEVLYPVFLGLRTKDGIDESLRLSKREDVIEKPSDDFFKLNANHTSLYRTSYSPQRLEKLGQAAKDGKLSVEDRAGMLADAGSLASSGYQKTSGVLSLLKGFDTEADFVVWSEIVSRLSAVQGAWMFEDKAQRSGLEAFQKSLSSAKAHSMGWNFSDKDGHIEQQFKALMFGNAGLAGDEEVKKAAKEMFDKYNAGDKSAIHPNIRGSVFAMALKYGGETEYDQILNIYLNTNNADERNTALRSLGRCKDPKTIQKTLSLILSSQVKEQDVHMPASGLRSHPEGVEALFTWMTENWDGIMKRVPTSSAIFGGLVQIFTASFTSQAQLDKVEAFFKDKDTNGFDKSLAQSLDSIRSKISWVERDRGDVAGWLKTNEYL